MGETKGIYKAMLAVMQDVPPISKNSKNKHFGYNFRGIDDVYQVLNPILAKHGVFMTMERINGETIRWHFHHEDGSSVYSDMKHWQGGNTFQHDGMAVSYSQRNVLTSTFLIPTKQGDLDSVEEELPSKTDAKKQEKKIKDEIMDVVCGEFDGQWGVSEKGLAKQIYEKLTPLPDDYEPGMIKILLDEILAGGE